MSRFQLLLQQGERVICRDQRRPLVLISQSHLHEQIAFDAALLFARFELLRCCLGCTVERIGNVPDNNDLTDFPYFWRGIYL